MFNNYKAHFCEYSHEHLIKYLNAKRRDS